MLKPKNQFFFSWAQKRNLIYHFVLELSKINTKMMLNITKDLPNQKLPPDFILEAEKIFILIISFASLIPNIAVCFIILSKDKLRNKVTHIFAVSLCITQMLVSGVLLPLFCFQLNEAVFNHLSALIIISYSTHLTAVTYERLQAVSNPLRYHEVLSIRKTFAIITFCWLVSFVVQLIPLTYYHSKHTFLIRKVFLVFILLAFLVCPLLFIIYTYLVIFREVTVLLRKERSSTYTDASDKARTHETISKTIHENTSEQLQNNNIEHRHLLLRIKHEHDTRKRRRCRKMRQESKSALIFVIVAMTYILSRFPVIYMTLLDVLERNDLVPAMLKHVSTILIAINSLTDPIVYGLLLKGVRKQAQTYWKKIIVILSRY